MAITALIRINVKTPSRSKSIAEAISHATGVTSANAVLGNCHIIAVVETKDVKTLGESIMDIRKAAPGIVNTDTSIALLERHNEEEK
jgi:DNA-binding Lrp family transcriptional regulator